MSGDANPRNLTNVQSNVIFECVRLREKAGLSQRDLARRLGLKSHMPISRWEKGRWGTARGPSPDDLIGAYAELMPTPDPGAIWRRAVRHWQRPVPGSPKSPSERAVGEAAKMFPPAGDER